MRVYNGESLKDTDPKAKSYQEYRDYAGIDEGMSGLSTRFAFKILSRVFNFDHTEVAANPVHLFYVLEQQIEREQFPQELHDRYLEFIKGFLVPRYVEFIGKEIQTAYLESYSEYGQNIFDRYVTYADFWIQDQEYRDPETGQLFDRSSLNSELEKIEKPAGISNPKDFRNEIVNFVLRARANNAGRNPNWTSYEKLRTVIEKKMFSNTEELLPVISFNSKTSAEEQKKHDNFVERMMEKGYTRKQGDALFGRIERGHGGGGGHGVANAHRGLELQRLAQVDGAFARQAGAQHGRNEASREHAVGDAALEHRVFGILGVQMHRVVVARYGRKQQNVRFRHGFGVFGALTNGEIFEVNSRHD
jgi:predicted Ser/Thr protein kinase